MIEKAAQRSACRQFPSLPFCHGKVTGKMKRSEMLDKDQVARLKSQLSADWLQVHLYFNRKTNDVPVANFSFNHALLSSTRE